MRSSASSTFALLVLLALVGCSHWGEEGLFKEDRFDKLRAYEQGVGYRIEQLLELAEDELINDFEKKKPLLFREPEEFDRIHPRKDLPLRNLIESAYANGDVSVDERDRFLDKCDDLRDRWEKQEMIARKKPRRRGIGN